MHNSTRPITPLAAVAAGVLAGAAGTVGLDTVHYLKYRLTRGTDGPLAWEFAPVDTWENAPAPGQVAKRVIEGFTQRELPDRWAWLGSTLAHWAYGSLAGGLYGVVAGSLRRPRALYGLPFGASVWAGGYLILPVAGPLRADLEVRRANAGFRPRRPSHLRGDHRNRVLASHQAPIRSARSTSVTIIAAARVSSLLRSSPTTGRVATNSRDFGMVP